MCVTLGMGLLCIQIHNTIKLGIPIIHVIGTFSAVPSKVYSEFEAEILGSW